MSPAPRVLLDLDCLQVTGSWRANAFDDWADVAISVKAFPFSGTVDAILTRDDLIRFEDSLGSLTPPGRAVLGGGRAAYLALDAERQAGGDADRLALDVTLIPSEDDGWPKLAFLIFNVDPSFGVRSAKAINEFLRSKEDA